jgi:hypothetical protein
MGYALPPSKRPKHLHGDTFKHFELDDTTEGRRAFIRRTPTDPGPSAGREPRG